MSLLRIAPNGVLRLKFILVLLRVLGAMSHSAAMLLLSWWQALYLVDNFQLSLYGKGLVPCSLHPQLASADLRSRVHARILLYTCLHAVKIRIPFDTLRILTYLRFELCNAFRSNILYCMYVGTQIFFEISENSWYADSNYVDYTVYSFSTALWCIANVHFGQRLNIVGTIWEKLSKLVFTLHFQFELPWSGSSVARIGTTIFAITLPFTLDDDIQ